MNIKKLLGKRLKTIREANKLTQEELSEKIGLSKNAISLVERGLNFTSPNLLEKLCQFYNVQPDYFFKFDLDIKKDDFKKINSIISKLKSLNSTDLNYVCKFIDSL